MDQHRFIESQYRIQHHHEDGSWSEMVEQPAHGDPAAHDTERAWSLRRIFRCTSCSGEVTLVPGVEGDAVEEPR
jgi:hypothetical protein